MKQEIELQKLREEDKMPLPPPPSKAPPTLQQVLYQAPPYAHSCEVQARPVTCEPFQPWTEFPATLSLDQMVHIVTDSGARPNPRSAGWGALIRQNGMYTYNHGHYDHASNKEMEIRAVVEALRILPSRTHVWVSTDSAYVKDGVTQWSPKWMKNNWKNSQGTPGANKSLWQKFYEEVSKQMRVEWSCLKAHNETLLNSSICCPGW
jgi:ribonuclease HI